MTTIQYQTLDRNNQEIRLIVLEDLDSSTTRDLTEPEPPLKCQLVVTSLNLYKVQRKNYVAHGVNEVRNALARTFLEDQPFSRDFYALSYVWGDPAAVCDIEVNGQAGKIATNLYSALQAIRKTTKFRVIWADALSINQADIKEKSWQVAQMSATYSRAQGTISWLGSASVDSDLALTTLMELHKKTSNYFWPIQQAMEGVRPVSIVEQQLRRIAGDPRCRTAISELCTRPYWSRIWIFQEMALARERYFLCGDAVASDIIRPIALLLAWQFVQVENQDKFMDSSCLSMISAVQTFRFFGDYPSDAPIYIRPGKLHDMLVKLNDLHATDPRDIIYALLGIATDGDTLHLTPDYSRGLEQIYKETACALLRRGRLGVLLSASSQTKSMSLPSWVPDWSARLEGEVDRGYCASKGRLQRSSTLKAIPRLADQVTLDGYLVGQIANIHDPCPATALESSSFNPSRATFEDWLKGAEAVVFPSTGGGMNDRKKAGRFKNPSSAIAQLFAAPSGQQPRSSLFSDPWLRFYTAIKTATSVESILLNLRGASGKRETQLASYLRRIQFVLGNGARPYCTDSGHIGLTWRENGNVGDVIAVIPGVTVPCLLRKESTGNLYRLVGVTYVHAFMHGEFFKEKGLNELQSFSLC